MIPVQHVEGRAYPLGRSNIDTDTIIAAQHLKTVTREGLGRHAFETIRAEGGNVFSDARFERAPILIAGANFGCGSSREHAAWALADLGIRVVIAPSFSDIFASNAFKNGIVTAVVAEPEVERLLEVAQEQPLSVDLDTMTIASPLQDPIAFELDPFRRECLMSGLDEIALTLASEPAIAAYEARDHTPQPMPPAFIPAG